MYNIIVSCELKGGIMKGWKHLNIEQRKTINHCLANNYKLVEISKLIGVDPTSISKEIKRNRVLYEKTTVTDKVCKNTLRFPYVCNGCVYKYTTCKLSKYRYDVGYANGKASKMLKEKRRGLDVDEETFKRIDELISIGNKNKESIYHIVNSHKDEIPLSVPTIYRYISKGLLSVKKMDLPYAVTYKRRKKTNKEYAYKNNNIDRSNRTFINYLVYKREHPGQFISEMDFLGAIKDDKKCILVLTICELHFPILYIIENKTQDKVKDFFDKLENKLEDDFFKVFPCILTDRDPCFADYKKIEISCLDDSVYRTNLFYCDAFTSSQKGTVENMNHQLRKYFPKGTSVDSYSQEDIKNINLIIINTCFASLGGATPKEVFIAIFGTKIFNKLF